MLRSYTRPIPLSPHPRNGRLVPPKGWQYTQWNWDDKDIEKAESLAATPLPGYVIVDIDDKVGDPPERRFAPADRLGAAEMLRKEGELVASYHSKTWPEDPLHGHWLFRSPLARLAARNHEYGERIRPNQDWVYYAVDHERNALRSLAQTVGEVMAASVRGEHGGLNNLANEWAFYLARKGASRKDVRPLWTLRAEVNPAARELHKRTVRGAWTKGQESEASAERTERDDIFVLAADLVRGPAPRPDLLDLLPSDGVTLLSGDPETFKSWIALYASAVHTQAGGVVLYIDADMSERQVSRRLDLMGSGDINLARVYGWDWRQTADKEEALSRFRAMVGDGPLFTVLDSGSSLGSGVSEESWESFLAEMGWDLLKSRGGLLLLEHLGKQRRDSARGSVGKKAGADLELLTKERFEFASSWYTGTEGDADGDEQLPVGRLRIEVGKDRDQMHRRTRFLEAVWSPHRELRVTPLGEDKSDHELRQDLGAKRKAADDRREIDLEILRLYEGGKFSMAQVADQLGATKRRVQAALDRDKRARIEDRIGRA